MLLFHDKCVCKICETYSLFLLGSSNEQHSKEWLSSVTQLCLTLCNPVDCSTPGFPGHHQLPELTQTMTRCPSSQWCHPVISSSVVPFSCLQSLPASGSFPVSQFFASGGQSIGGSASIFPVNIYDWFPLRLESPWSPKDSQESFPTPQFKSVNSSALSFLYSPTLTSIHDYWKHQSFD